MIASAPGDMNVWRCCFESQVVVWQSRTQDRKKQELHMSADWHDSRDNLQSTYISLPIAGGYFDNHFIELPP